MVSDVSDGSIASVPLRLRHVCLSPNSNRYADILDRQLRASSRHRGERLDGLNFRQRMPVEPGLPDSL